MMQALSAQGSEMQAANIMKVSIHSTLDDIEPLLSDWSRWAGRDECRSIFVDARRLFALAPILGRTPFLIAFREGLELRAIIIAERLRSKLPIRLGYFQISGPDLQVLGVAYGGILADPSFDAWKAVVACLQDLFRQRLVDMIAINHLSEDHEFSALLRDRGLSLGRRVFDDVEPHRFFKLVPGSFEQTMSCFSKKHQYNLRRRVRQLEERFGCPLVLRIFNRPDQVEEFIRGADAIVKTTYQAALGVGLEDTPLWRQILTTEASSGRWMGFWIEDGQRPIAFQSGVIANGMFALEATAFRPEFSQWSPGIVLLIRVFEHLCHDGTVSLYDYGFGEAEYKKIYSNQMVEERSIRIYGSTVRASLAWMMDRTSIYFRHAVKRLLGGEGGVKRMRKYWRNRLQKSESSGSGHRT